MAKTVLKEIVIGILLLVIIILLLGILLYDYIPNSVTVPAKVQAHEMPSETKEELKETLAQESQNIIKTYYIDSSALTVYENLDSYDKGKRDPFTSYEESTSGTTTGTTTGSTSGSTSGSSGSNASSSNNQSTNNNSNNSNSSNSNSSNSSNSNNGSNNIGGSDSTGTYFDTPGKN